MIVVANFEKLNVQFHLISYEILGKVADAEFQRVFSKDRGVIEKNLLEGVPKDPLLDRIELSVLDKQTISILDWPSS